MQDSSSNDQLNLPIDKGWEQMSAQLDEVMPQRRRRFVWWWLPLLLLTSCVAYYAWSQLGISIPAQNTGDRQELLESTPVAEETVLPAPTANETAVEGQVSAVQSESLSTPTQTERTDNLTSATAITPTSKAEASANNTEAPIVAMTEPLHDENVSDIAPSLEEFASTNATQAVSTTIPEQANVGNAVAPAAEQIQDETRLLNIIAPLAGSPTSLLNVPAAAASYDEVAVSPNPKLRWYVEGMAGEALGDPYASLIAGVGAERTLGKSWVVNSGLQYQYSRSAWFGNEAGVSFLGSTAENDLISGGGTYDISSAYQNLQTQRANVYLRAAYRIHPRIQIGLGAQASYFTKASANISFERAVEPESNPTTFSDAFRVNLYDDLIEAVRLDEFNNAGTGGPVPLEVKRWQWSVMSTFSYRLHSEWSIEAQYLRHLTAWPAEGEVFGGPHNVQLGVRYYFRK
ncbi:MAG: hypothetical protein AAFP77_17165 [Bacteroidota bacterium]